MKDINIPAQIVMLLAFAVMTSSFWCKKRENILKFQIVSSALFVVQYVLLGAYTGAVLNAVSIARAVIFAKKNENSISSESKGKKVSINWSSNVVLYIFIAVFVVLSVITWDGIVSIYAFIATLVFTIGLWADKPQNIRLSSNIASVFWWLYNFSTGGYVGCVTEIILFTSNTVALYKNRENKKVAQ